MSTVNGMILLSSFSVESRVSATVSSGSVPSPVLSQAVSRESETTQTSDDAPGSNSDQTVVRGVSHLDSVSVGLGDFADEVHDAEESLGHRDLPWPGAESDDRWCGALLAGGRR